MPFGLIMTLVFMRLAVELIQMLCLFHTRVVVRWHDYGLAGLFGDDMEHVIAAVYIPKQSIYSPRPTPTTLEKTHQCIHPYLPLKENTHRLFQL